MELKIKLGACACRKVDSTLVSRGRCLVMRVVVFTPPELVKPNVHMDKRSGFPSTDSRRLVDCGSSWLSCTSFNTSSSVRQPPFRRQAASSSAACTWRTRGRGLQSAQTKSSGSRPLSFALDLCSRRPRSLRQEWKEPAGTALAIYTCVYIWRGPKGRSAGLFHYRQFWIVARAAQGRGISSLHLADKGTRATEQANQELRQQASFICPGSLLSPSTLIAPCVGACQHTYIIYKARADRRAVQLSLFHYRRIWIVARAAQGQFFSSLHLADKGTRAAERANRQPGQQASSIFSGSLLSPSALIAPCVGACQHAYIYIYIKQAGRGGPKSRSAIASSTTVGSGSSLVPPGASSPAACTWRTRGRGLGKPTTRSAGLFHFFWIFALAVHAHCARSGRSLYISTHSRRGPRAIQLASSTAVSSGSSLVPPDGGASAACIWRRRGQGLRSGQTKNSVSGPLPFALDLCSRRPRSLRHAWEPASTPISYINQARTQGPFSYSLFHYRRIWIVARAAQGRGISSLHLADKGTRAAERANRQPGQQASSIFSGSLLSPSTLIVPVGGACRHGSIYISTHSRRGPRAIQPASRASPAVRSGSSLVPPKGGASAACTWRTRGRGANQELGQRASFICPGSLLSPSTLIAPGVGACRHTYLYHVCTDRKPIMCVCIYIYIHIYLYFIYIYIYSWPVPFALDLHRCSCRPSQAA